VPITYYKLSNGLRVILSPDFTAPTVVTAVYYRIGFRVEPKDRTGFAHLFEHMMFQRSRNLGKMEFIRLVQQNADCKWIWGAGRESGQRSGGPAAARLLSGTDLLPQ
jgi:hypothetical protein